MTTSQVLVPDELDRLQRRIAERVYKEHGVVMTGDDGRVTGFIEKPDPSNVFSAAANTGIPGIIGGYGAERVIHSPAAGHFRQLKEIGSKVRAGETIGTVVSGNEEIPVNTQITGILRGIIRDGFPVTKGFKLADVDPRLEEKKNCFTISDKARCIAGSVLELVTAQANRGKRPG